LAALRPLSMIAGQPKTSSATSTPRTTFTMPDDDYETALTPIHWNFPFRPAITAL
jgi:hypothetical protein